MINILFAAKSERWDSYKDALNSALQAEALEAEVGQNFDPTEVDYIIYAPNSDLQDFAPYIRAKAVLNLWAGVEHVVHNPSLQIPLARMVERGLTEGMVEWVTGHVLRHHLGMDAQITGQTGDWVVDYPPLARDRRVGVLGLGELGLACAYALSGLRFDVAGWSRSAKQVDDIETYSGKDGLADILFRSDILVLLLPQTPETENVINERTLGQLPEGAVIINPGRGGLIDDDALLAALDNGHIGHATLDVFRTEPLPKDHPYWGHPKVTVTPHIASATRVATSCVSLAENIRRMEDGQPLIGLVDRSRAY